MENLKEFFWTCVENPFDSDERLSEVIDWWIEIKAREFIMNCNLYDVEILRDIIKYWEPSFTFYKFKTNDTYLIDDSLNDYIYFYIWSAIEHFYT